jgi:hypothetical protein
MTVISRAASQTGSCLQNLQLGCLWTVLQMVWIGLLVWGLVLARNSWDFARNGVAVTGTVVSQEAHSDDDGTTYSPVVEFNVNGGRYEFTSGNSSSPPAYRVGQSVPVRYDPVNPQRAQIDTLWENWLAPAALAGGALLMAVIVNVIMIVAVMRGSDLSSGD